VLKVRTSYTIAEENRCAELQKVVSADEDNEYYFNADQSIMPDTPKATPRQSYPENFPLYALFLMLRCKG